jgi:hypothetical protein
MHLQRRELSFNYEPDHPYPTLLNLLEITNGNSVLSIWTNPYTDMKSVQANIESWEQPSLTMVRGTLLGAADFRN